jgi:hypothetical protein
VFEADAGSLAAAQGSGIDSAEGNIAQITIEAFLDAGSASFG